MIIFASTIVSPFLSRAELHCVSEKNM